MKRLIKLLKICTLSSGSDGNCIYITDGTTNILIDAGISVTRIICELGALGVGAADIDAVFVTHEHSDHISGLLRLLPRCARARLYASCGTKAGIEERIPDLRGRAETVYPAEKTFVGEIAVTPFHTPHDTRESVGFRVESKNESIVIATDIGHVDDELLPRLCGCDLLLLEANYDERRLRCGKYPIFLKNRILGECGHLSNDECARCAVRAAGSGTKSIILAHLSRENNTPRDAYNAVHSALTKSGAIPGVDVMLYLAPRGKRGEVITVNNNEY